MSSYTVTFKDHNGNVLKTQSVEEGNSATAPANPTRTGYSFNGWDVDFDNITSNTTVTAKYIINTYTVTFKDHDGKVLESKTVNYGTNAIAPANPTRTGYIFKGWNNNYSNVKGNIVTTALYSIVEQDNNSSTNNQNNNTNKNNTANNVNEEKTTEPNITINDITNNINAEDLNKINSNIKVLNKNNELINIYDVNFILDGVKIQPDGYIDVKIPMTDEQKGYENLKVIYINDDNEVTVLPHTIDGNYIVFSVNHLSNYAIIGTKVVKKTDTKTTVNVDNTDKQSNEGFAIITGNPVVYTSIILATILVIIVIIFIIIKRRKNDNKN